MVLAAGASTRLGKPKQLLNYHGKTLLKNAVDEAANAHADAVVVVVGANANLFSKEMSENKVTVVENKGWQEGMASSVRCGLSALMKSIPTVDAVIFMVCDQPHVTSALLNDLIKTQKETGKPIVACNYGDAIGPPALFHKKIFSELLQLKGDAGARRIIQQNGDEVAAISFPEGNIDIDTAADYEGLQKE